MSSCEAWKSRGNSAFVSKDFDESIRCYTEAIKLQPNDHILYSNRSGSYALLNKYEEALSDAIKCIEIKPDWPKGYSRKGLALYHLGKIEDAIDTYKKGIELDPNNESLTNGLIQAEAACPDTLITYRASLMVSSLLSKSKFSKYAQEDPEFTSRVTSILTEILKNPQTIQIALAVCIDQRVKEALSVILNIPYNEEDINTENLSNTKVSYSTDQNTNKKEEPTQKNVDKVGKTSDEIEADDMKAKGNILYQERKFNEALDCFNKAIEIYPSNVAYHMNITATYFEMENYDDCIKLCEDIIAKKTSFGLDYVKIARLYGRIANCYRKLEDYDNAIKAYKQMLLEDNTRETRRALEEVKSLKMKKDELDYINHDKAEEHRIKGNELFKKNLYPKAKAEYDEAIRRNPKDARLFSNRSAAYMKLGEYGLALDDIEKSLSIDSNVAKVWARKGNILTVIKNYNQAMNAYNEGLKIDEHNQECLDGLNRLLAIINMSQKSDKVDEDQIKQAMYDPEIQKYMSDPQFCLILNELSKDPSKLSNALKNPQVAAGIEKLISAGILKVA